MFAVGNTTGLPSPFVSASVAGVSSVVHTATLHQPHVATRSWQDFIDTNVTGTHRLLEAAVAAGVESFVYVSTTSVFGAALMRPPAAAAAWTQLVAENLCELTHRKHDLPIVVLRTSRFFPEEDDDAAIRREFSSTNGLVTS
jgi:UDP-glucose 4-epimerase